MKILVLIFNLSKCMFRKSGQIIMDDRFNITFYLVIYIFVKSF